MIYRKIFQDMQDFHWDDFIFLDAEIKAFSSVVYIFDILQSMN